MPDIDVMRELGTKAWVVNRLLADLLDDKSQINGNLKEALSYTLKSPGKRLRAALVLWCCELLSGRANYNAQIAAAAIEMVHTYSLVHDDLPAMDDDAFRRGQPSCHKAFDEATAILAGDALLTLAFEVLAEKIDNADLAVKLIGELAGAAGAEGMIAGQMADLSAENTEGSAEILKYIHTNKTAKMFRCACACGAIAAGANEQRADRLRQYGFKVGLAFQIADDILDVSGTSEHLGKTPGKDARQGKVTYPAVFGLEKSKQVAEKLANEAVKVLTSFGPEAELLRRLPMALLERTR